MQAIVLTFMVPVVLLNMFGGLIGGGWLLYLGMWKPVVFGLCAILSGSLVLGFMLLPSIALVIPLGGAIERGSIIAATIAVLVSVVFIKVVMTIWSLGVFDLFLMKSKQEAIIPLLLWSYTVAVTPWGTMARYDQQTNPDSFSAVSTAFLAVACISVMIGVYFFGVQPTWREMLPWFLPALIVSLLFQTLFAAMLQRTLKP